MRSARFQHFHVVMLIRQAWRFLLFSYTIRAQVLNGGGLGFRDLHVFDMLARQTWWFFLFSDTLCAYVLDAKYFPGKPILKAKAKGGISHTWRGIIKGAQLLKDGIIWRMLKRKADNSLYILKVYMP